MNYGDIIKRSWRITWRYKALWVLGIFAGVSAAREEAAATTAVAVAAIHSPAWTASSSRRLVCDTT
jgi:hypothetical protein